MIFISAPKQIFDCKYEYQWEDEVIQCNNNDECLVKCNQNRCCHNATVNCPILNHGCHVKCSDTFACNDMYINWIPGHNNTLDCNGYCNNTPYPPPINDNSAYNVTCDQDAECLGTIIRCPTDAACHISCSAYRSCRNSIIYCPTNGDCNIVCTSTVSCAASIIYCPAIGKCNLECTGIESCRDSLVYWSQVNDSYASLLCPSGGNQCNFIKSPKILNSPRNDASWTHWCNTPYYCHSSTINCPRNGDCIVNCLGDHTCFASIINCPINGECHIVCDGEESCTFAIFNGPIDNVLTIFCDGTYACLSTTTHAQQSSYFNFTTGSSGSFTASATTFYFPPNNGISPRAFILALYDGFNGYNGYGPSQTQQFYALNGWKDVDIHFNGSYEFHEGIMHCNIDYVDSCPFAEDSWQCDPNSTICDKLILQTTAPTPSPTVSDLSMDSSNISSISTTSGLSPPSSITYPTQISGSWSIMIIVILLSAVLILCVAVICLLICRCRDNDTKSQIEHVHEQHQRAPKFSQMVNLSSSNIQINQQNEAKEDEKKQMMANDIESDDMEDMYNDKQHDKHTVSEGRESNDEQKEGTTKNDYLNWTHEDIFNWIMSLDNGRFEKYKDALKQSLFEEELKGSHFVDIDKSDIHRWGIKPFEDKQKLYEFITQLIVNAEECESPML